MYDSCDGNDIMKRIWTYILLEKPFVALTLKHDLCTAFTAPQNTTSRKVREIHKKWSIFFVIIAIWERTSEKIRTVQFYFCPHLETESAEGLLPLTKGDLDRVMCMGITGQTLPPFLPRLQLQPLPKVFLQIPHVSMSPREVLVSNQK
jgi:hypothetical protein